jgi:crotonobetainyl-CoA:carnitine CoA-transferase CaiB-like acyl-CoA transferase
MLKGLKVVELASYVAAPGAGGILADWGAKVVKIESTSGDAFRRVFDTAKNDLPGNPVFELDNRGKRGIAVDIRTDEGREILRRLTKDADVFLTNVRPAALERSEMDWDSLHKHNPKLIYATVTGYGLEGPDRDRPGFDVAAFWCRSGMANMMAVKGTSPGLLRMAVGDHITSIATVSGIMAALYQREKTGKGQLVEASLLRTGIYAVSCDLSVQLMFGRLGSLYPREKNLVPANNFYRTADDRWLTLVPRQGDADWPDICKALGRPDIATDERFNSPRARREHAGELTALLDEVFATKTRDEWAKLFDAADVVWAPAMTAAEVVDDPQAIASGAFTEVESASGKRFRSVNAPVRFRDETGEPIFKETAHTHAPAIGEHTNEVLGELGFSHTEIDQMREGKIIR